MCNIEERGGIRLIDFKILISFLILRVFFTSFLNYSFFLVLEEIHEEKGRYAPEKGWLVLSDRGGGGRGSRE